MIVSEISKKGNWVNILFDNNELFKIPYELFVKNNLYVDDEISEDEFFKLKHQTNIYQIRQSSFRYLGLRNHSNNELKIKLLKKGFDKNLIENVIIELTNSGFLNDKIFAENYFQFQIRKKKGKLKIQSELIKKGINREIISEVGKNFDEDFSNESTVYEIGIKKFNSLKQKNNSNIQIKQKLFAHLVNKGFTTDLIGKAISKIMKEDYE
ncbi:MAG: regulatory protein RecX [Ignavibacteriae bacterium]|nr:regulatory protein RecX [Ignavibacteriota bacterium]